CRAVPCRAFVGWVLFASSPLRLFAELLRYPTVVIGSLKVHNHRAGANTSPSLVRWFGTLIGEVANFMQVALNRDVPVPDRYREHSSVERDQTEPAHKSTEAAFRWLAALGNGYIDGSDPLKVLPCRIFR
ncbi:MAG: hypothetical protein ACRDHN_08215, partial [Thermomicrobiales bacterium]